MHKINKLTDEEVVEITRTKDKQAYGEIIKRYQNKLMRYVTYLLSDENRAADVVQDSLVNAYINLNSFNSKKKFSSWIYRIVHNHAINISKKHSRETVIGENWDIEDSVDIEADYTREEIRKMVTDCLGDMPVAYREVLTLYYLEDKKYLDISDILRIPMGTVGVRMRRAKILMKKICQKRQK
ncbi:sigma-70 family RNA polymerase sigma factor [Candidatus Microgenomates bacterium]|nr:MAG: sigma-70 family RNA polymerase sigma factor [Candidatus Microgenomates bacterium]